MKIRVTLLTENDVPFEEALKDSNKTEEEYIHMAKLAWDLLVTLLEAKCKPNEKVKCESVEIVKG